MRLSLYIANLVLFICSCNSHQIHKRALQKSHEKTQLEKWESKFLPQNEQFDQTASLVGLVNKLSTEQLSECTTIILYDTFTENSNDLLLEKLFRTYPIPYVHGQITDEYRIKVAKILTHPDTCVSYIFFLKDVMRCRHIIGPQTENKVVVVARSSQWRVYEFLASEESQSFMNLLVVVMSEKATSSGIELPYILYTHRLYIDALGSSTHQVLASWRNGSFTQFPNSLFPKKIVSGFAGHRFIISVAHQPPFVIKKGADDNDDIQWEGIEIRLVNMLARVYNFSTDYREAKDVERLGGTEAVSTTIKQEKANIGIAGLYASEKNFFTTDISKAHSQDCAAFISLTSIALPRYRAIMGPFHWTVWLALTMVYLLAIFPLAFSDKHTIRHLIERPEEIENMFWYVFGTFTNCFTFTGKNSWSQGNKVTTRLLIGFYWIFSIIITACYTGSIIAFVTLPVYPATIDTEEQLINGRYQIGTLNKGGWQYWFENSSDPLTTKLLKNIDLVPNVEAGLKNTTKAFFWPYAFMGSRAQLDYIVRTNFTTMNKRSLLHISSKCFVPFSVSLIYNKDSLYSQIIDNGILRAVQSGLIIKLKSDVEWNMMRSATGKLLAASSFGNALKSLSVDDRALTLDDTQGMFLLLGIGFLLGGCSLLSEWLGGCWHLCKRRRPMTECSIESNYRSHNTMTPREKLDSLRYNSLENSIVEEADNQVLGKTNCIVHNGDCDESGDGAKQSLNIEEQLDGLFSFNDNYFGDRSIVQDNGKNEELLKDNDTIY